MFHYSNKCVFNDLIINLKSWEWCAVKVWLFQTWKINHLPLVQCLFVAKQLISHLGIYLIAGGDISLVKVLSSLSLISITSIWLRFRSLSKEQNGTISKTNKGDSVWDRLSDLILVWMAGTRGALTFVTLLLRVHWGLQRILCPKENLVWNFTS